MWGRAIEFVVVLCLFLWGLEDRAACAILLCGGAAFLEVRSVGIDFLGNKIEFGEGGEREVDGRSRS